MPWCAKLKFVLAAILALAAPALAQNITYEKYKLDNGLTVILREDHTLPVAAVNLWYRVGAKDELPGRSGFAHLFEHLMFMGTQRVPGSDFDNLMEAGGGANNASTSLDRTNYFSSGPASLLPTLLWLDADRLEDLGRTMDQEKLDRQRDIVRNEIRQNVENAPYGKAYERIYRLMYPKGHPYHEAVYGTHEDLEAATVTNVKDFFATYYVPANASLVVAGDFDPAKIKPLIAGLFGTIPAGGAVIHRSVEPVKLGTVLRGTMLDKVQLPMLKMVWHSPALFAPGDAEMDLVAAILTQGKNSRLYKRLVYQDQVAVDVSATQDSAGLGSLFTLDIQLKPDADPGAIERSVDEELARLIKDGPTKAELDERIATIELGKLASLQSIEAVADKLNEYEYQFGEPNSFKRDLDRYRSATVAGVREWAAKVLSPQDRLILRVLPEEPERTASARDTRPADLAPSPFTPPAPEMLSLKNGMRVMLWNKPELPLISASVLFRSSGPIDSPGRAGLAGLTAQMTDEGAGDLDALQFAAALQALGASYSAGASQESASASVTTLKRNFDRAMGLMADALRRPRLAEEDWARVKSLHLDQLRQQADEPTVVAARVGLRALFGDENPYGWPTDGTVATVSKFTLNDIKSEHRMVFRPDTATILVAGDIKAQEALPVLERLFGDWAGAGSIARGEQDLAPPRRSGMRVILVDRPEAVQTVIRFMAPGTTYLDQRRVALRLINTLLGGSFTSRLNQNLREQHGYTYGAGSRFVMGPSAGYFVASSSVKADVTGPALKEFMGELKRLRTGDISDGEATKARETLRTDLIQSFQGLGGLLRVAGELITNGVAFETLAKDLAAMESASAAGLNGIAKDAIPLEQGVLVLVGDKKLILDQIKDLGLPAPTEVSPEGDPVTPMGDATAK